MHCPRCYCKTLRPSKAHFLERMLRFLTGLIEYVCYDCETRFRAPDRRRDLRSRKMYGSAQMERPAVQQVRMQKNQPAF